MNGWQPGQTLEDIEKIVILSALGFYQNNKSRTASALGITAKTLYNKMEKFKISLQPDKDEKDEEVISVGEALKNYKRKNEENSRAESC